jgi:hypothetical protein
VVALVAMIFLAFTALLALGMYEGTNVSVQVSGAEVREFHSQLGVTTGTQFIKYHLGALDVANTVRGPQLFDTVYAQLGARINNTGNMPAGSQTVGKSADNTYLYAPASTSQWIAADAEGSAFRVRMKKVGYGDDLEVTVFGKYNNPVPGARTRAARMTFRSNPYDRSVLKYGMASRAPVKLSSASVTGVPTAAWGSVFSANTASANPVTLFGGAVIDGDVYLTHPAGSVPAGGTIAGIADTTARASHVHPNAGNPEFPSIDPSPFIDYLVGRETVVAANIVGGTYDNIRIRAGTNITIDGGAVLRGVVLIEAPNQVTIKGGSSLQGVIVVANPEEGTATNSLTINGNMTLASPAGLPDSFGEIKTMLGSSILAPNFTLNLAGGASTFGGTVYAKQVTSSGGAGGSVAGGNVIIGGSSAVSLSGGATFTFTSDPAASRPAGIRFRSRYLPVATTYVELAE